MAPVVSARLGLTGATKMPLRGFYNVYSSGVIGHIVPRYLEL